MSPSPSPANAIAPAVIRGQIETSQLTEFGRGPGSTFLAPDPRRFVDRLPLTGQSRLADLYDLTLDDITAFLARLGTELDLDGNPLVRQACEASFAAAPTTPPIVEHQYRMLPALFRSDAVQGIIDSIGRPYLEGWVPHQMVEGHVSYLRAFGARTAHIVAGNSPLITAWTIVRNAITRSDAIIKVPSNDPYTASAIARTMVDMAPDHPVTRHLSVAYWKGGDETIEKALYQPYNIDKIVAWGGFESVRHVTRYIQPGLELISLDPKRSASVIGAEAFESETSLEDAAARLAFDIGALNQEGCVNARLVYVQSGTSPEGIAALERFGKRVYQHMVALPEHWSTPPKHGINRELKGELKNAQTLDDWYTVIGGRENEGAIVISRLPEPVPYATLLSNRVANLVPIDEPAEMLRWVDAYTQTVGVYPDTLLPVLADPLALKGAQRIVSLGYAAAMSLATPAQDGLEPLRRMCKWVLRDHCDPALVQPGWARPSGWTLEPLGES